MSKRVKNLGLAMMVKNEHLRISVTFDSVKDYVSTMYIFDTGSTDGTQEIMKKYCEQYDITLHLKEGNFVNFQESRNVLLDLVDEHSTQDDYVILLDCNDEMQNMDNLVTFITEYKGPCSGFYLTQRWWTGHSLDSYYNVRMIRPHFGWRYKNPVHEYIMTPLIEVDKKPHHEVVYNKVENVFVFQDRTKDDDKSYKRFTRDKELLYAEHLKNPTESRTLFYLAQTCGCLGQHDEAYKYYLKRIKAGGFYEEIYHSYFRLGDAAESLGHNWEESFMWYMKAYQHSQRAEPLYKIAKHYQEYNMHGEKKPEWHTCFMYASMACQLTYPTEQILFIDKNIYSYARWHVLGISAYYAGKYTEGKEACLKAIEAKNQDIDKFNLKHYIMKEAEMLIKGNAEKTSNCLIANTMFDKEIRAKDELEHNHNRTEPIREALNKARTEIENKGLKMTDEQYRTLKEFNFNAKPAVFNNVQPPQAQQSSAAAPQYGYYPPPYGYYPPNMYPQYGQIPPPVPQQPRTRKDKRAQLKEKIIKKANDNKEIRMIHSRLE